MSATTAEVVICGAGIAGIAAAHALALGHGVRDVLLVERGDPLALTSDKSTEAYRDWWPDPAMVQLMGRSIDMLEAIAHATDNAILLNRRGYLYATADAATLSAFRAGAEAIAAAGAGPLRLHGVGEAGPAYQPAPAHGFAGLPRGADLLLNQALIRAQFPYLTERTLAVLHARRAGWFSAWQLGAHLLEEARAHGVRLLRGELVGVETAGGRVRGVEVATESGTRRISTPIFVSAAGPLQAQVGQLLGLELPLFNELHLKAAISDPLGVVPRDAPLLIWNDPVALAWSTAERAELADDPELRWLLDPLPGGVHGRPEGSDGASTLLLLWDYHTQPVAPRFPIARDPQLVELALRGMATMLPGLSAYVERVPQGFIDGGYYTRTRENRPLIGPLPVGGAYISGGYSGFGLMAACAAGELLAAHIAGAALPAYAPAFALARYEDPAYVAALAGWGGDGQL